MTHVPDSNEIISFAPVGGNFATGQECFALRLGLRSGAPRAGWPNTVILGITNPAGEKRYIAAAFPPRSKTNLAMMTPSLQDKVECAATTSPG